MVPDERTTPGAYLTDGKVLYEVLDCDEKHVALEDCGEGGVSMVERWRVKAVPWRLVKKAPVCPDRLEDEVDVAKAA